MVRKIGRRGFLVLGVGAACSKSWASPGRRSLSFQIWRNGAQIGDHAVSFALEGDRLTASIKATMRVKIGPVPVFNYRHEATEVWAGEHLASFVSRSVSNDKVETVEASPADGGMRILAGGSPVRMTADAAPLTHWNRATLKRPMFNPQTGALVHCSVSRRGPETVKDAAGRSIPVTGWAVTGDADIVDWYDEAGDWTALRGKAPDGSWIDYRRA